MKRSLKDILGANSTACRSRSAKSWRTALRSSSGPTSEPRFLRMEALEPRCLLTAATELPALAVDSSVFEADKLLVRFSQDFSCTSTCKAHEIGLANSDFGVTDVSRLSRRLWEVWLEPGKDVVASASKIGELPGVVYAEPDYRINSALLPNDPQFTDLWGLDNHGQTGGTSGVDINAPEAWELSVGSGSAIVAVIDTGIDYTHPDLAANLWTNVGEASGLPGIDDDGNGFVDDIHGFDFANNDGDPMDDHGHGTHVAGTIGAVGDNGVGVTGINWNVQIMALKFLNAQGSGQISDAVEAIGYAVAQGANISNNSWGFNGGFSQALYDAIADARDADHVFLAAAGNGNLFGIGQDNDTRPLYPASFDLDNIIAVAATDDHDQLATFSNFGVTSVDLAAPGVGILSTTPGNTYSTYSGTSMATPHVAGVVALLRDLHPDLDFESVIDQVLASVDPIPAMTGKSVTGGRLNAAQTLVPDTRGPTVISNSPTANVHGTLSVIRITFDEDIDPTSVSLSDIVNFTGPGGTVEATSLNVVPGSRNRQIAIHFPTQDTVGMYQMTIGPQVLDRAGNLMNQDGDDTNGEADEDTYTATVSLISTNGGPTDYVAFWQFDEGAGDVARDTSGNGLTGTLHGGLENSGWSAIAAPTSYPGAFSLGFDGTNDHVSLPSANGLNVSGNAVTVSVWVKLDELPADISGEDFASIFDSEQDAYVVYLDKNNNELRFKVTDATGAAKRPGIPSAYMDTTRWHQVTGVYDGSTQTASIYLDGALMDTHTNPSLGASVRSGQVAAIGRNGNADRYYFNGAVDDIRIYDRALTPSEVTAICPEATWRHAYTHHRT